MVSQKKLFILTLLLSFTIISIGVSFLPVEAETIVNATDAQYDIHIPLIGLPSWINPFGYESSVSVTNSTYKQLADDLDGSWTRINRHISWRKLQPVEGGAINWSLLTGFEEELRTLRKLGIKPIVVVDDYPAWATIISNSCSALRTDKFSDFANFTVALVNRYKTLEFSVKDWELGNEVDIDPQLVGINSVYGCWGDINDFYYGGRHYGEMVKVVGQAIKTADPHARVWLGGLILSTESSDEDQGNPENFLRGVLAVRAAPYFDVISYHGHIAYYGSMQDPDYLGGDGEWKSWGGSAVGKPRFLRSIMQEFGVDKPLSIDEVGVGCVDDEKYPYCQPPTAEFYQFQANMAVRYAVRVLSERVESFIWFTLNSPSWRNMGLVYDDESPRPVFFAYKNLVSQTEELTYSKMIDLGVGIEAHEFLGGKTRLLVVWTDIDEQKIIEIPQTKFQAAYDRDGNPISVDSDFDVAVGFAPIYLVYLR